MQAACGDGAPLRLLLAERHARVRGALRVDLEDAGHTVCVETADAEAAIAAAGRERPDVCLAEATLDGGAAALTARLREAAPGTRVLLLAFECDSPEIVEAFRRGAAGCIPLDVEAAQLRAAVAAVARGDRIVPRRIVALVDGETS